MALSKTLSGTEKVNVLNRLAYQWMIRKYDSCKYFATEALQLAEEINYLAGKSEANIFLGNYEAQISGNIPKSLSFFRKGRAQASRAKNRGLEGFALTQTGNLYRNQGKYDSAILFYNQSFNVLKDSLNPWHLSMLYRNMGKYYGIQGDKIKELNYLKRAWVIRSNLPDYAMKVDALVSLSKWYETQSEFEVAEKYIVQAEKFIHLVGRSWVTSDFYMQKAMILFHQGNAVEALKLLTKAKSFYSQNSAFSYSKLLNDIGEVLEEVGDHDASLLHYFEALKISTEHDFGNLTVRAQLGIGRNYYRLNLLPTSITFASQALNAAIRYNYKPEEATGLNLLGLIKKKEKKYNEAIVHFEKALIIRKQLNDKKGEASTLGNIGEALEGKGELNMALETQLRSLAIKEASHHQSGLAWAYYDLGSVYAKLKDVNNAKAFLDKAEALAKELHISAVLINVYQTRRNLAIIQGKTNEALDYSFVYEKLKDSVGGSAMTNRILTLQVVYDLEKQNKEIELLTLSQQDQQNQIAIQEAKIKQQKFILSATVIGLILVGSLAYLSFSYYRKTTKLNRVLKEQNEEIQTQSEELTESNSTLISFNKDLAEKQEEIQAMAEELTEANQSLTLLNMNLAENGEELAAQSEELTESNQIILSLNENLEAKVNERTQALAQAYKELDTFFYRSSHDFRRPLTTFMGLAEVAKITVKDENALSLFDKVKETAVNLDRMLIKLQSISDMGAEQFIYKEVSMQTIYENTWDAYRELINKFGIRITISVGEIKSFQSYPAFLKIIVDNLVENSIQFCGRNEPYILLDAKEIGGGIQLTVQDNGQGVEEEYQSRLFDMFFRGNEHSKGNGLGLYIVKKAVGKMNGQISLISNYQQGTTVTIWFPSQLSST